MWILAIETNKGEKVIVLNEMCDRFAQRKNWTANLTRL